MVKKGRFFGVKCDEGFLVNKDQAPIVAKKENKRDLKKALKKLKKKNGKFDSCELVDVTDRMG